MSREFSSRLDPISPDTIDLLLAPGKRQRKCGYLESRGTMHLVCEARRVVVEG